MFESCWGCNLRAVFREITVAELSTVKTRADIAEVAQFVKERIDDSVTSVLPLTGGEIAQAYEIKVSRGSCVFRLSPYLLQFQRDQIAAERFSSEDLPIPPIIKMGHFKDNIYYGLSEKAAGEKLSQLDPEEFLAAYPSVMETLAHIHRCELPEEAKYGAWSADGEPSCGSWHVYLTALLDREAPVGKDWEEQERLAFCRDSFHRICEKISCTPRLVHGDYGAENLFILNSKVSAVIDWGAAMYGDPVFDLAWLSFWYKDLDVVQSYSKYNPKLSGEQITECMPAYWYFIGLRAVYFFRNSNQEKSALWAFQRLNEVSRIAG